MKKLFLFFIILISVMTIYSQTYKQENNTFSKIETSKSVIVPEKTIYLWKDSKGETYPICISKSGSCFIIKTSSKTGKEYRYYLPTEVSQEICKQMNIEYKKK